jgi:DNA polymerase-3 subunit delta
VRHGEGVDAVLQRHGVWRRRQPLVKQALRRFSRARLAALLRHADETDAAVKGAADMPPWEALTGLVLAMLQPARRA